MPTMTIGEIARRSAVGVETIRYYEREGLLARPARRPSGYRQYDGSALARLRFIRRAKDLGFTLAEIKDLLGLKAGPGATCDHVRERARRKVADIERKVRDLREMKRALEGILRDCEDREVPGDCPLLGGPDKDEDGGRA